MCPRAAVDIQQIVQAALEIFGLGQDRDGRSPVCSVSPGDFDGLKSWQITPREGEAFLTSAMSRMLIAFKACGQVDGLRLLPAPVSALCSRGISRFLVSSSCRLFSTISIQNHVNSPVNFLGKLD